MRGGYGKGKKVVDSCVAGMAKEGGGEVGEEEVVKGGEGGEEGEEEEEDTDMNTETAGGVEEGAEEDAEEAEEEIEEKGRTKLEGERTRDESLVHLWAVIGT